MERCGWHVRLAHLPVRGMGLGILAAFIGLALACGGIVPRLRDFTDFGRHLSYLAGWRSEAPRFGTFTWWEKFEFWAVVWGTSLMGLTGLTLAFPETASTHLPRWVIGVARGAHSNEALLSFLAVLIGHSSPFTSAPTSSPAAPSGSTDACLRPNCMRDHAAFYEALGGDKAQAPAELTPGPWAYDRTLIAVEMVIFLRLVTAVYVTFVPYLVK